MLQRTFILNSTHYVSPPILKFQSGVFHSFILWDIAHMQHTTIETLLIHVSLGCSATDILKEIVFSRASEIPLGKFNKEYG